MGKQCWSQAVLESGSWGHSVLQTPALVYMPVRKMGHIMLRGLASVVHPSVRKLFHFRLTLPTVYIRSS